MNGFWRRATDELGWAAGVLALLLLTLLSPIHSSAEARIALGESRVDLVLCSISADRSTDEPGTAPLRCDLCVLAHVVHSFGPAGVVNSIIPPQPTTVRVVWTPGAAAISSMPRGALPEARAPPVA